MEAWDDMVLQKIMLWPNLLLVICTVVRFQESFLAGRFTRVGVLVVLSSLPPLWYCLRKRMWKALKVAAAFLNIVLFLMCAYVFCGISHILFKSGMTRPAPYIAVSCLWILGLGAVFSKERTKSMRAGTAFDVALCLFVAAAAYFSLTSKWMVDMNVVLYGTVMAIAALNVCLLLRAFEEDSLKREAVS